MYQVFIEKQVQKRLYKITETDYTSIKNIIPALTIKHKHTGANETDILRIIPALTIKHKPVDS